MEKIKYYLTPVSVLFLALSIIFIGQEYLTTYKRQNNYSVIQISSTDTLDKIQPTVLNASFNISFGRYDENKGPSFEQTNGAKSVVLDINQKLKSLGINGAKVTWNGGYPTNPYSTSTLPGISSEFISGIKIEVPVTNNISESDLNKLALSYKGLNIFINRGVTDDQYKDLTAKLEASNAKKNRQQAEEKAINLGTKILDLSSAYATNDYGYQNLPFIEENSDGTLKMTSTLSVSYTVAK